MSKHVTVCGRKGNVLAIAFVVLVAAAVYVPIIVHQMRPCVAVQTARPGTVLSCRAGPHDGSATVSVHQPTTTATETTNTSAEVLVYRGRAVLADEAVDVAVVAFESSVVGAGGRAELVLGLLPGSVVTPRVVANTTANVTLLVLSDKDHLHMRYAEPFAPLHKHVGPPNTSFVLVVNNNNNKEQEDNTTPVVWVLVLDNREGGTALAANVSVGCRCRTWNRTAAAHRCTATPGHDCTVGVHEGDTLAVLVPPDSAAPLLLLGGLHFATAVTAPWTVVLVAASALVGAFVIHCAQKSLVAADHKQP